MKFKSLISSLCLVVVAQLSASAQAEVVIHGTRIVYPADARETTVQVTSSGLKPSLVQVWIDDGDPKSTPENSNAPFVITPPLSRVDAGKSQAFRVLALPSAAQLSQTQETLYWLNVLDIPAKPKQEENAAPMNYLQLAIRSRIKFFYRPTLIQDQAAKAGEKIQWLKRDQLIIAKNPTPFFITIKGINQTLGKNTVDIFPDGIMLKPFPGESVNITVSSFDKLRYVTINDFGGDNEYNLKF